VPDFGNSDGLWRSDGSHWDTVLALRYRIYQYTIPEGELRYKNGGFEHAKDPQITQIFTDYFKSRRNLALGQRGIAVFPSF
jgi:hypothetical protein